MLADALISRLEGVRRVRDGRWVAKCCAHSDRSASLSITETDDRVLIHCFAGCGAVDVLAAVGLDLSALYPPMPKDHRGKPGRRDHSAYAALKALGEETKMLILINASVRSGKPLDDQTHKRLLLCHERISAASEACGVR